MREIESQREWQIYYNRIGIWAQASTTLVWCTNHYTMPLPAMLSVCSRKHRNSQWPLWAPLSQMAAAVLACSTRVAAHLDFIQGHFNFQFMPFLNCLLYLCWSSSNRWTAIFLTQMIIKVLIAINRLCFLPSCWQGSNSSQICSDRWWNIHRCEVSS